MLRFMAFFLLLSPALLFLHGAAWAALIALALGAATPVVWLAWQVLAPPTVPR